MPTIDYFYAVISPFAYLGASRLQEMAARRNVRIVHKPMKLADVFAVSGGVPLPQRAKQRQEYRLLELRRISKRFGLPLNLHPKHFPVDDKLAARTIIAAQEDGEAIDGFAFALMRAVWAEERDISASDTVRAVADGCGLDGDALLAKAQSQFAADRLEANTKEAIDLGVFGSPTYVFDGEIFWGQDRIEYVEHAIAEASPD